MVAVLALIELIFHSRNGNQLFVFSLCLSQLLSHFPQLSVYVLEIYFLQWNHIYFFFLAFLDHINYFVCLFMAFLDIRKHTIQFVKPVLHNIQSLVFLGFVCSHGFRYLFLTNLTFLDGLPGPRNADIFPFDSLFLQFGCDFL